MKLTSMKNKPSEDKKEGEPVEMDEPSYPYGLRLDLNDDSLELLGIDTLPNVGGTLMLTAKVKVEGVSQREQQNDKYRSVELQITDMALEPYQEDERMKKMYPSMTEG